MIDFQNLCFGCMNEKMTDGKCPICGYSPEETPNPLFLIPGSKLFDRYIVGKMLENNGEGVTYIGYDSISSSIIHIREFFPTNLCERFTQDGSVSVLPGKEVVFTQFLSKFVELSNNLYSLNGLPALFDTVEVFETNNTAYRIINAKPGISLREFLMRNGGVLKWDQARALFAPLIASISQFNKAGIFHMGISPDTIVVCKDGKVRITGFCIEDERMAQSALASQLFPGFAAIEQYGEIGKQGPWTDVYGYTATLYRTLVGTSPAEATERYKEDHLTVPAKIVSELPKPALEAVAGALQVMPQDRIRNIDEIRKGLTVSSVNVAETQMISNQNAPVGYSANNTTRKPAKKRGGAFYGMMALLITVAILSVFLVVFCGLYFGWFGNKEDAVSNNISKHQTSNIPVQSTESVNITQGDDTYKLENFVGEYYVQVIDPTNTETGQGEQTYLERYNFKITSIQYDDDVPKGVIISQSPAANEFVKEGTTIELVISEGPYFALVPNLKNQSREDAEMTLLKSGFVNYEFIDMYDENETPGVVIKTDPLYLSNSTVTANKYQKILVYVNTYMGEPVPDYVPFVPDVPDVQTPPTVDEA